MTLGKPVQGWAVTVNVNGEDVLTISHNHLAGVENIDDYADVVRECGRHLLSFIGNVQEPPPHECYGISGYCMECGSKLVANGENGSDKCS